MPWDVWNLFDTVFWFCIRMCELGGTQLLANCDSIAASKKAKVELPEMVVGEGFRAGAFRDPITVATKEELAQCPPVLVFLCPCGLPYSFVICYDLALLSQFVYMQECVVKVIRENKKITMCQKYMSPHGYCGSSAAHRRGTSCRKCPGPSFVLDSFVAMKS